jgi:hypothetical protein
MSCGEREGVARRRRKTRGREDATRRVRTGIRNLIILIAASRIMTHKRFFKFLSARVFPALGQSPDMHLSPGLKTYFPPVYALTLETSDKIEQYLMNK